jgi:hypothetical protein
MSPGRAAAAYRSDIGQVLLVLGLLGVVITSTLLALNWAAYEDRSDTELGLLVGSLVAIAIGGGYLRSVRLALLHALSGVLLAATFLAVTSLTAWYRSAHFFPPRSRVLLECALAGVIGAGLAVLWLRRARERG